MPICFHANALSTTGTVVSCHKLTNKRLRYMPTCQHATVNKNKSEMGHLQVQSWHVNMESQMTFGSSHLDRFCAAFVVLGPWNAYC